MSAFVVLFFALSFKLVSIHCYCRDPWIHSTLIWPVNGIRGFHFLLSPRPSCREELLPITAASFNTVGEFSHRWVTYRHMMSGIQQLILSGCCLPLRDTPHIKQRHLAGMSLIEYCHNGGTSALMCWKVMYFVLGGHDIPLPHFTPIKHVLLVYDECKEVCVNTHFQLLFLP